MIKLHTILKSVKGWTNALTIITFHFILLHGNFFRFRLFSLYKKRVKL